MITFICSLPRFLSVAPRYVPQPGSCPRARVLQRARSLCAFQDVAFTFADTGCVGRRLFARDQGRARTADLPDAGVRCPLQSPSANAIANGKRSERSRRYGAVGPPHSRGSSWKSGDSRGRLHQLGDGAGQALLAVPVRTSRSPQRTYASAVKLTPETPVTVSTSSISLPVRAS